MKMQLRVKALFCALLLVNNGALPGIADDSASNGSQPAHISSTNQNTASGGGALSALHARSEDTRKLQPGDRLLVFDYSNSTVNSYLASNPKPLITATAIAADGNVSYPPLGPTVSVTAAGATLAELSKKFNDLERSGGVIAPNVVAILRQPDIPDFAPKPREAEMEIPPLSPAKAAAESGLAAPPPVLPSAPDGGGFGPPLPVNASGSPLFSASAASGAQTPMLSTVLNSQLGVSTPGGPGISGLTVAQQLLTMNSPGSVNSSILASEGSQSTGFGNLVWTSTHQTVPGYRIDFFFEHPGATQISTEVSPGKPGQNFTGKIEITGWVIPRFRNVPGEPERRVNGNFHFEVPGGQRQLTPLVSIRPDSIMIRLFGGPGRWGDRWQIISWEQGKPFTVGGRHDHWIPGSFEIAWWPGQRPWRTFDPGREIVIKGKEPWWGWRNWKEGDQYVPGYSTFENQMDPRLKKGLTGTESYSNPGTPDTFLKTYPTITDHPGWPDRLFVSLKLPESWWREWQKTWPGPQKAEMETGRPRNPPWRELLIVRIPGRAMITVRRIKWPGLAFDWTWRDWKPGKPGNRWWWLEQRFTVARTPGSKVPPVPGTGQSIFSQSPPWLVQSSVLKDAIANDETSAVWLWTDSSKPFPILKTALDIKDPFRLAEVSEVWTPFTLPALPGLTGPSIAGSSTSGSNSSGGGAGGGGGGGMVSFVPSGGSGGSMAGAGGGGGGGVAGCLCGLGALNGEFDNSVSNTTPELAGFHVKIQAGILTLARLATRVGGVTRSNRKLGEPARVASAASSSGVVLGARAKGGDNTKITGQVFFSAGGPVSGNGGLDQEELIDVNGLDGHQYVAGRILKAEKDKVEIATKQGKHLVIATSDICSIRSPRVVNFNIPLMAGQPVDSQSAFRAKTGPIEFCRSESALRSIQKLSAHIENDEPIRVMQRGLASDARPLVAELKGLLLEIEHGPSDGHVRSISQNGARRIAVAAQSIVEQGSSVGSSAAGSKQSDGDSLDERNVEWCRDFLDWWQAEGSSLGGDSLERISRLINSGLQGAALVAERNRLQAPTTRVGDLISVAESLLAVGEQSNSALGRLEEPAAGIDENFPIPFNEQGTIVRACSHADGAPCTVRFCTQDNRLVNVTNKVFDSTSDAPSCVLGSRVRFSGAETMPDFVSGATSLDLPIQESTQLNDRGKLWSVQEAFQSGVLEFALKGDGKTVDHCRILMTNQSCKPLRICVPEGQFFLPDKPTFQIMMMTEDRIVDIPAGSSVWLEVATLGASVRKFKRPPPAGVCYRPDCYPDPQAGRIIQRTWEWANYMNRCQAFSRISTLDASKRPVTIAQIAVWRYLYKVAELADNDKITRDTVLADYFPTKKSAEPIYPERLADKLWAASDLVMSLAKKSVTSGAGIAKVDADSKISILPTGNCRCGP